jgi:hypothetical protein
VPESLLQKGKCEEQWAADRKEKALADRKKALESCKIILTRAKQYVQDYDAQVSDLAKPCLHMAVFPDPSRSGCTLALVSRVKRVIWYDYLADACDLV